MSVFLARPAPLSNAGRNHLTMAGIDAQTLRERHREYLDREGLAVVEDDRLETLPAAFADGSYLWKDCEWIVRWYLRRPLESGSRPEEDAFRGNRMNEIESAVDDAVDAESTAERLEALLALDGVDVRIASAFLQFMDPERYAAIDEPCWDALVAAGDLEEPYPDPVRPSDYERYLAACREHADQADLRVVDVGRALWRLGR